VSCKSIPDGWLADNWKFTVGTVTAKLKSSWMSGKFKLNSWIMKVDESLY
jgi:hypothetical protein